jgi:hypothetical protein
MNADAAVEAGTWVEVRRVVLPPAERAAQIPPDTRRVPLELRVKGFLVTSARLGKEAVIRTTAGRRHHGMLLEANPAYSHGFGPPVAELSAIGGEVREILRKAQQDR